VQVSSSAIGVSPVKSLVLSAASAAVVATAVPMIELAAKETAVATIVLNAFDMMASSERQYHPERSK
jgi:hypothetical protein